MSRKDAVKMWVWFYLAIALTVTEFILFLFHNNLAYLFVILALASFVISKMYGDRE